MYINKAKAIKNYSNTEASANLTKNSFQIVETILIELKRIYILKRNLQGSFTF